MMYDKHYKGEGYAYSRRAYSDKIVSVRLSDNELKILEELYPGANISFAIRSAIYELKYVVKKM